MKNESRSYKVWSESEEQALREGVRRHGVGSWEPIRQDKSFSILKERSGVQLKDKWRNMVKFRKLDGKELQNLPRRAAGPWSKKMEYVRVRTTEGGDIKRGRSRCEDRRYGIYDVRRYSRSVSSEDSDASTHECETVVVACLCGIDFDDGQPMIECTHCKQYAHKSCLSTLDDHQEGSYTCPKCRCCDKGDWTMDDSRNKNDQNGVPTVSDDTYSENTFTTPQQAYLPFPSPFRGMSITTAAWMLTQFVTWYGGRYDDETVTERSLSENGKCSSHKEHQSRPTTPIATSQFSNAIHYNPRKRKHPDSN